KLCFLWVISVENRPATKAPGHKAALRAFLCCFVPLCLSDFVARQLDCGVESLLQWALQIKGSRSPVELGRCAERLICFSHAGGIMLPIRGVYEVAIRVKDLSKAEAFYLDVLDLEVGIRDEKRNWLFLKAGGDAGMGVLQEDKGEWPLQHFAFTLDEADLERAAATLRERGVEVEGPVFHE